MGLNDYGQLGDGTTTFLRATPFHVLFAPIFATPVSGLTPLTVQFTGPATDNEGTAITNWIWHFGDNQTSTHQSPMHTYAADGTFTPTLSAINGNGSSVSTLFSGSIISASYLGLVLNGGFETGSFYGWTRSGNSGNSAVVASPVHSGRYDSDWGPTGSSGFLSQTLATTAGTRYLLSFWVTKANSPPTNDFTVSWGGTSLLNTSNTLFSLPTAYTNFQFVVTATNASTALQFGFQADHSTYYLDDVSVTPAVLTSGVTNFSLAGTNLVVRGTNGVTGEFIYSLLSTDLTLPMNQWTPVATNVLGAVGRFSITTTNVVDLTVPQRFFIFQFY